MGDNGYDNLEHKTNDYMLFITDLGPVSQEYVTIDRSFPSLECTVGNCTHSSCVDSNGGGKC